MRSSLTTAAALAALGLLAGCASKPAAAHVVSVRTAVPATPPSPSPTPTPTLDSQCTLGFAVGYEGTPGTTFYTGGGFFPDTQAGLGQADQAASANGYTEDYGAEVTISNPAGGQGTVVASLVVEITDASGNIITQHQIKAYDMPRYLAPGESDAFAVDLTQVGQSDGHGVTITTGDYLTDSCTVVQWYAGTGY